jgi:hypothetical protein
MKRLFLAAALLIAAFTVTYKNTANALPSYKSICGSS